MREQPGDNRTVLITGASSGIGRACALTLDARGFRVFAGVRTEHDAQALRAHSSERLATLLLDITRSDDIARAFAAIEGALGPSGLSGLINNAGICVSAPMELVPIDSLRRQLDVNVVGQVAVTQAFLPLLRCAKGRIINIGSTSGRVAGKWIGPYCASKSALDSITTALRLELLQSGVQVCLIEPGAIATPFWDKILDGTDQLEKLFSAEALSPYAAALARRRGKLPQIRSSGSSPDVVADVIFRALMAPHLKARYVVGLDAKLRIAAANVLPERLWTWLAANT